MGVKEVGVKKEWKVWGVKEVGVKRNGRFGGVKEVGVRRKRRYYGLEGRSTEYRGEGFLMMVFCRCVYERVSFMPTLATFTVSAWWHGFYPGYFFCFTYYAFAVQAARKVSNLIIGRSR